MRSRNFGGEGGVKVIWRNPDLTGFSLMMASLTEEEVIEALDANCHGTPKDKMEGGNKELNHLVLRNLNEESACENGKL